AAVRDESARLVYPRRRVCERLRPRHCRSDLEGLSIRIALLGRCDSVRGRWFHRLASPPLVRGRWPGAIGESVKLKYRELHCQLGQAVLIEPSLQPESPEN